HCPARAEACFCGRRAMKSLLCTLSLLVACASSAPKAQPRPAQAQAPGASAQPQGTPDSSFRARPPPPGTAVEFHAPIPTQLVLRNGLPVFLIELHDIPLISVALALRSGADTEPRAKQDSLRSRWTCST